MRQINETAFVTLGRNRCEIQSYQNANDIKYRADS